DVAFLALIHFTCTYRQPGSCCPTCRLSRVYYPYVSPGPLLPGTRHPPRCRGGAGPRILTRRTDPSPSSVLSRLTSTVASSRTWVAQAVESAVTVSWPSAKLSGRVCAARSAPTISAHRPNTEPIAARCCQP